ncbi:uncharacterized protein N7496_004005 [Penicillium cataractarum]|uniref:NACHT domain-containing protein n=1 Tax=Penicillium cataractarum TaxID=2100454 RepID=A0A9W9SN81_9EURO|nr:uncharacterized protein N7496_004005 [Penicillium cataractarum]KAJ5381577.1 hypothetical protein N7496_004005 [Penicillium cataractarum]
MSFGIGVGDFLAVIKLATKVRREFAGAPDQFKAISDEVRNLSFVVQDVEIDVSSKDLDAKQQTELEEIAKSCCNVLGELESMIHNYRDLGPIGDSKKSIAKRAWKRLKWEPNEIQELRQRIISNIALLDAFNGRMTRTSIRRLVQCQDDQKRQELLTWLSPLDYGAQQSDYIARRQPGTGQWLLDSPEFQSWISGSKQTLFCPGIPGAGKTILTSIVIEELYDQYRNDGSVAITFLYCSFRRRHEQGLAHLLASLLRQLAQAQPDLPSPLSNIYDEHRAKSTRPKVEELSKALESLAQQGGFSKVFVVIDALDECDMSNRSCTKLLDTMFDLQASCNVNLFATSRFIPEITERFQELPTLEIRASKEDVTRYLRDNLSILPSFVSRNKDLQDEISTAITTAVDGMFLLAQLYLNSLVGKRSPKAIRSALKGLSSDTQRYDSAYDDAMKRIQGQVPDKSELALQVLAWITCAKRPLTTIELQTALAVEVDEPEFDPENLPDLTDMVSVCAGLVTVDEQSDIIRLVHYTTQEYFERNKATWFPRAHHSIGRICVAYLSSMASKAEHWLTETEHDAQLDIELNARLHFELNNLVRDNPLIVYAGDFWGHHVNSRLYDDDVEASDDLIIGFLSDIPKVNCCARVLLWVDSHSRDQDYYLRPMSYFGGGRYPVFSPQLATGLHLAIWFVMPDIIEKMISRGWPVDSKDACGRTPLFWAVCFGLSDIVSLLLENGADPGMKDRYGHSPLYASGWLGSANSAEIAGLLVEQATKPGAAIGDNSDEMQSLLLAACMGINEPFVKLLLECNVDVEAKSEDGRNALSLAALYSRGNVVRLLLERGSDSDSPDDVGRTAFHYAASQPDGTIVASLFAYNPNGLNRRDLYGRTPLHVAATRGKLQSVRALLAMEGIDCEIKDNFGRTALDDALGRGYDDVAKAIQNVTGGIDEVIHPRKAKPLRRVLNVECDACMLAIRPGETWYHCFLCRDGDFDLCNGCYQLGAHCLNRDHGLAARAGTKLSNNL